MNGFIRSRIRAARSIAVTSLLAMALFVQPTPTGAQATITPNYKDADIQQIIEAVGAVTGKNFIIDPRVKAQVTMVSSTPLSAEAFYEAFLSILQVYGYVAVPAGNVIKIVPDANARQMPGWEGAAENNRRADDIETQVILVKNVAAAQLVPILRPLIPQYGHLAAHPASNMLIISDRSANVDRILRIIRRIDQSSDEDYEVIRLTHASAAETVRVVSSLQQGTGGTDGTGRRTTVVADERTNSILVSGEKTERLRLRTLIAHLDTPLEDGGDTRVRYLRYADSLDLAAKLESQYSGSAGVEGGPQIGSDISIWADEQTNALVVTAPPKLMRSMMSVIDKIDIRRAQVLVEAIIVEVSADNTNKLGITWAVFDDGNVAAAIDFPDIVPGVSALAGALNSTDADAGSLTGVLADGINLAAGKISDTGTSWAGFIQALESDADTNIMATPTLVTMDNEEAEINVGQEVPFVTGSFTNTGSTGGAVNPFQTVEREQVGLTLKITPQINEGDAVLLKIDQEVSSLAQSSAAVDLITNNRTVTTTVIVNDGSTLVLGGLMQDELREIEQRVPILGSLPLIGALFRAKQTQIVKTNLMIFIRPTILRDDIDTTYATHQKYDSIRTMQLAERDERRQLFPGGDKPILPEFEATKRPTGPVIDLRALPEPEETADASAGDG